MAEGQQRERQLRAQFQKSEEKLRVEGQVATKQAAAEAQAKGQEQLEEARRQWRREMEQARQQWQSEVEKGKRQGGDTAASQVRGQLQGQLDEVRRQWEEEVKQIRGQWGEEVRQVKLQCAEEVKQTRVKCAEEVSALRDNEQRVESKAKDSYEEELATLSLRHSSQMDNLTSQLHQQKEEIQRLRSASQGQGDGTVMGMGENEVRGLLEERDFLVRELNGLGQHHHQLEEEWRRLCEAHDQLTQELQRKQTYIQDTQRLQTERDRDQQKRIEHLTQTLATYNSREEMFTQQIENLQLALKSAPQSPTKREEPTTEATQLEARILQLQTENKALREQVEVSGRTSG